MINRKPKPCYCCPKTIQAGQTMVRLRPNQYAHHACYKSRKERVKGKKSLIEIIFG